MADCLRQVASAANPTMEVPVGTSCEDRIDSQWVCDRSEYKSYEYPQLTFKAATRLTIYAYTTEGFVRLDGKVRAVVTQGEFEGVPLDTRVGKLTTSSETYDLSIPGHLQTLNFQNGFLYAIASGVLQVYAMGESSLVQTSSLVVANESLQTSLFSADKLYLSDFGYAGGMDHSTLRVIDLASGGFPKQVSEDYQLPGGQSSILPTASGIFTIGSVVNFQNTTQNAVKLGLFTNPFASEKAYLILATDLAAVYASDTKAHYFNASNERLFLPYSGYTRGQFQTQARIGLSHVQDDAIVSDGALTLLEPVQRVRPRPVTSDQVLGFGTNTVVWIKPDLGIWKASPVLAYFTPIALYRLNDQDDYVEVSRLGPSCKLGFANATALAQRSGVRQSEAFDCGEGPPLAYGQNIVFDASHAVSFDAAGDVTVLAPATAKDLTSKAAQRPICLFSDKPTDQPVDYKNLPSPNTLKCYSPAEYQTLVTKRSQVPPSTTAQP